MTACVNRKHTKKVAAVVTASLVGALSLGAAPVAAMADTGTGIETLATDFENVSKSSVDYEDGLKSGHEFYSNGNGQALVPETVTDAAGVPHEAELRSNDLEDGDFFYYFVEIGTSANKVINSDGSSVQYDNGKKYVDVEGNSVKVNGAYAVPSTIGDYAVVVGQYKGGSFILRSVADTFSIVGFSLDDAALIDGRDITDTTFEYTGEANSNTVESMKKRLGVAVGSHILTWGQDYNISIYPKSSNVALNDGDFLTPGGEYVASIRGIGSYEGNKQFNFTMEKLDLSTASIVTNVYTVAPGATPGFNGVVKSINGVSQTAFDPNTMKDSEFEIKLVKAPNGNEHYEALKGVYTFSIKAKATASHVKGETTVSVVYANNVANVDFSGCGTKDADGAYVVDYSLDKPTIFDLSHIKVTPNVDYTVTVTDDEGNVIDMAGKTQLDQNGTYYVKVDVYHQDKATGDLTAGSDVAKVVVSYGKLVQTSDIFMTYKGENVQYQASDTYNGTDLSKNMGFTVKAGDKTLTQGTDYTVTFEKQGDDGKRTEVDQIIDAGTYIITVKGETFTGGAEFKFVVNALQLTKATPVWDLDTDDLTGIDGYLMYTGEVLNPEYRFFDADGNEIAVPEGSFVVDRYETTAGKKVELKDAGKYYAFFETAKDVENYDFDGLKSDVINVTARSIFLDVPLTGEWYSQVVYDAVNLGYMNGYSGTKLFGAGDSIKRGDVACVLFNMAGGDDVYANDDFSYSNETGYKTGFEDVDGTMYYGKAIAWAHATGVINGYGDGTFKPEQTITAEEFACMLANYAEAIGEDVDGADKAVLDTMSDGDQVSDWAEQSVAWAVENEVMGNGGFIAPLETIARERVAAMAVNYQPEKLLDEVIEVPDTNPGSTLF